MRKILNFTLLLFSIISFAQTPGWLQTANGKIPATDANPKNLKLYEKFIRAHNDRDLNKISKMAHDSIVVELPDGGKILGKENFINVLNNWFNTSNPIWNPFFAYSMKVQGQKGEWVIAGHTLKDKPQNLDVWDLVDIYIDSKKIRRVIVYRKETKPKVAATPSMEFGGWSGSVNDSSKESVMTRELMKNYTNNTFDNTASMMADDGSFLFNSDKVSKAEWIGAASVHHQYFDNISNSKIQAPIVTTATYDNGTVWSLTWFWWTGIGKTTGKEVQIPVHHGFRFENDKIVEAYHFFDPTLLNAEIEAATK
jgi:ketosteroid isomerase-like protein